MESVRKYLDAHADEFVEQLKEFLRIPTVSADPKHKDDMRRGAEFVRDQLTRAGVKAEIQPTAGHPIVYGEWTGAAGAPTALVYGHYDVQPADPLHEWVTPAFEPTVRNGRLYARGATDNKGQVFTHMKSVEAWLKTEGRLPINVKFVIEGEEEVGSNNLDTFLESNREKVACDVAVVSDTSQFAPGVPAITYGLRGIYACEFRVKGPNQDLHSGVFGGAVANPINVLASLIASLHDGERRVTIPGFYDSVRALTDEERKQFANLPFDEAGFLSEIGVAAGYGERDYSANERRWARPTCDVNGITGGYQGTGPKTIVPAWASAKLTCRLVPDQDPRAIGRALEAHLRAHCPPGITLEYTEYHGCDPLVFETGGPYFQAAREAIRAGFGTLPVLIREGGSIPVVATFREVLGVDTLLLGWGQNSDNLHSPNEHFSLDDFRRGTASSAALWPELAKVKR